jgi:hypothetical protein
MRNNMHDFQTTTDTSNDAAHCLAMSDAAQHHCDTPPSNFTEESLTPHPIDKKPSIGALSVIVFL